MADLSKASNAELLAKIAQLEKSLAAANDITLTVSEKGCVSVGGLGRFPMSLYPKQMLRVLDAEKKIRAFIDANKDKLSWEKRAAAKE